MRRPSPLPAFRRATRGSPEYRHQPSQHFGYNVPVRVCDGANEVRGERVGNKEQGYLGPVIGGKVPYITTTSRADFMSAFNKRANYHTDDRFAPHIRSRCVHMIRKLVPKPWDKIEWDVDLYTDWLGMFDFEKQARMQKAYKNAGLDNLSGYSNKKIFTKIEALVKDPETVAPRLIFQGTDYYNMISGPIFKVLMDRFVSLGNNLPNLNFLVAYKQHTPDIVEFLESKDCKSFVEADFSSNDKTQLKDVIELECMLMSRLGAPKWFVRLHRASNKFSVHNSKYGISAIVENQMPSGVTDGTFRNCFLNLCIFYCWAVKTHTRGALLVILGDDMLAGLPSRVRRASRNYRSVASSAGMIAKVTASRHLAGTHFLSKHFVPVTRGENAHVMLPFVGKMLAKFNTRPNSNQGVTDDEYMAGKALSHCYEYRFCHCLRDLFVERANLHLARSAGKYSLEGVTYHVRVFAAYRGEIEALLGGTMDYPDLVTKDDLTDFWLGLCGMGYCDLEQLISTVVLEPNYEVLDSYQGRHLVDY